MAMRALLERPGAPTGVFIANLSQALGALAAVRDLGLSVPGELSIVCHDDDPVCEFLDPPLSAIRMPLHELGASAVDMLIEQIEGGPPRDLVVATAPELLARASTGPAPP